MFLTHTLRAARFVTHTLRGLLDFGTRAGNIASA